MTSRVDALSELGDAVLCGDALITGLAELSLTTRPPLGRPRLT